MGLDRLNTRAKRPISTPDGPNLTNSTCLKMSDLGRGGGEGEG